MDVKIVQKRDAGLLAKLNEDVQKIHHDIEPGIFKAYDYESMKGFFHELLEKDTLRAFIVHYLDRAAGYMLLTEKHLEETAFKEAYSVLSIDQICVEKAFKGKGLGKVLVDFAKDQARAKNISRLEMNYWSGNSNSGEFFRSQGFKTYNERLSLLL
jgi:GNAT superfamily N-acetyltransferase